MLPDSPSLNNPQLARDISPFEGAHKRPAPIENVLVRQTGRKAQHGDAGVFLRWKNQGISKTHVKGDQTPPFPFAHRYEFPIVDPAQLLSFDGHGIVSGLQEQFQGLFSKILIQLQSHLLTPATST